METAVKSAEISFMPRRATVHDTFAHLDRGGSVFYSGGFYKDALRNLSGNNEHNMHYGIQPSIFPTPPTPFFHRDAIAYTYVPTLVLIDGEPYKAFRTSNNKVMFPIYDKANLPHPEESQKYIQGWLDATEMDRAVEYVKLPKFTGLTMASKERAADSILNKYVTDIIEFNGPNNYFGTALSMSENLRQRIRNYLQSHEGIRLAQEKGADEDIGLIGVRPSKGAIYAIDRLKNGKVCIFGYANSYESLSREAEAFGLTVEDMIEIALAEEFMHHYRKSYDKRLRSNAQRIEEERATKEELLDFYIREFTGAEPNQKLRSKYRKSIRNLLHDVETVERYKKLYRAKGNKERNRKDLEYVLRAEAEINGLEGEEAENYVRRELEKEIGGEAGGLEKVLEESENKGTFEKSDEAIEEYKKEASESEYENEAKTKAEDVEAEAGAEVSEAAE